MEATDIDQIVCVIKDHGLAEVKRYKEIHPHADWNLPQACGDQLRPAHHAAELGKLDILRWLVEECGVELDLPTRCGRDTLGVAAAAGQIEVARYLCGQMDVNPEDNWGNTPLHYAAREGHLNTCQVLVANGAMLFKRNAANNNPVDMAECAGNHVTKRFLMMAQEAELRRRAALDRNFEARAAGMDAVKAWESLPTPSDLIGEQLDIIRDALDRIDNIQKGKV